MKQVTFDFAGKNFIVTGASSGMGKQIALELAEAGANVLAVARRENELQKLKERYPDCIVPASIDVCDEEKLEIAIKSFVSQYGKIDGAVHAAGISILTPLKVYDEKEAKQVMDISFWAGVKLMQIATKAKYSNIGASFLAFSSVCVLHTEKGLFAYASSKAAIKVAMKTFAKEVANRKLRVNIISPGWVNTNMTAGLETTHNLSEVASNSLLGYGEPEDVSGMVLFLLSDRAKWITGTDVIVDGGYLA